MIHKLEDMCANHNFDKSEAIGILSQIDINQEFDSIEGSWDTLLLESAITHTNTAMVKLLLESGADPNIVFDTDESPLWNLQYNYGKTYEENEQRLIIAQLILEYGANPNINPENGPENLFEFVLYTVFNDNFDELWTYRIRFFILLVAYGGKSDYCKPKIIKPFDKTNMKQYKFHLKSYNNGMYGGVICDSKKNIVAYI